LNKVSGHFHIAPHRQVHETHAQAGLFSLLDLIAFTFDQFNVSHRIHSLSFGEQYPGMHAPLDNSERIVSDTHGMYQYYLQVVPTRYDARKLPGSRVTTEKDEITTNFVQSNQYSFTEYVSHLAPGSGRGLPGVYFYYEISPISASIMYREKAWSQWLVWMAAWLGGAYTLMGLLDMLVITIVTTLTPKSLM
jgi:endoplasmic reticulum-Golgi intermediate compartment protein 3